MRQERAIKTYMFYEIHSKVLSEGYDWDINQTPLDQLKPLLSKAGMELGIDTCMDHADHIIRQSGMEGQTNWLFVLFAFLVLAEHLISQKAVVIIHKVLNPVL